MKYEEEGKEVGDFDHCGNAEGAFGLTSDLDEFRFDSRKECVRRVFDELLVAFLSTKLKDKYRPIPPLCGDGEAVDLFKLFWIVRRIGGCHVVTRNNLWGFVSEECKSGYRMGPAIKIVYVKYLNDLNYWLAFSKNSKDWYSDLIHKLDVLSRELQIRFKKYLPVMQEQEEKDNNRFEKRNEDETPMVCKKMFYVQANKLLCRDVENNANFCTTEEDEKLQIGDNCHLLLDGRITDNVERRSCDDHTDKRVRKAPEGVDWLTDIEVDDDGEKYFNKDCSTNVAAAKNDIEKLINNILDYEETVTGDESERFSSQATNVVTVVSNEGSQEFISNEHNLSDSSSHGSEKRFSPLQDSHAMISSGTGCGSVLSSHKRKRESLSFSGMLNWLTDIAKRCIDPKIGSIPECSKWSEFGNTEFWANFLIVRKALTIKKPSNRIAGCNFKKDQPKTARMHPSMYDDDCLACQSVGKLRCSKRISSPAKSLPCTCCNSSIVSPTKDSIFKEAIPAKVAMKDAIEPTKDMNDLHEEKQVSIGPLFQADVPEWTGIPSESDPKWLGRRMWPPEEEEEEEDGDRSSRVTFDVIIGKGRQISCKCPLPNSVECVRFHNAEKRFKLKQELGSLFYRWHFDRMGEEVSLSWTDEEESTFRDTVRACAAASPNMLWKKASKLLPSKTREKLVRYYFNVFLIRHRSYQNRTSPDDIDSDDDGKPCGSISGRLGDIAVYADGLSCTPCVSNMQSTEFR